MNADPVAVATRRRTLAKLFRWEIPVAIVLLAVPWFAGEYQTSLVTYGLTFAIAALGFNLLLGYTGLLSFGHSAFFGVGAYAIAFLYKYGKIDSMEIFLAGAIVSSILVSALFGIVCVRYTRIFFSILTLALSQVLWSIPIKFFWSMGGTDGLRVPTPKLLGGLFGQPEDKMVFIAHHYYYYVLIVFFIAVTAMWIIVNSPFGKALQAIRDNEVRAEFIGIQIRRYRWLAFVISGIFTGVAGALWAPLNGLTTPEIMHWTFSGKIVFMAVLGGFQTFLGPIVGGIVYNYLETYAVGNFIYWQMFLGIVLVVLVLALPGGIVGTAGRIAAALRRARP